MPARGTGDGCTGFGGVAVGCCTAVVDEPCSMDARVESKAPCSAARMACTSWLAAICRVVVVGFCNQNVSTQKSSNCDSKVRAR